jgi:DNA mismatch repair protein MutS
MSDLTPVMRQYHALKRRQPDALLLFRMGDFYELFYDDARIASQVLGLTLTAREKHRDGGIPMAGVPWHAAEGYIARLVRAGHRVAIADQTEDSRFAKGLVARDVVEIVTPGTATSESLLVATENNYLASVAPGKGGVWGLAVADVSTGEFSAGEMDGEALREELARLAPAEILYPRCVDRGDIPTGWTGALGTAREDDRFFLDVARRDLMAHFRTSNLEGFGIEELPDAVRAAGALLAYLREMKGPGLSHLRDLRLLRVGEFMYLDDATLRNLDVFPERGSTGASLAEALDRTETAAGSRWLRRALRRPLLSAPEIRARLDVVEELVSDPVRVERLGRALRGIQDVERLVGRAATGRASPRDLGGLRESVAMLPHVREALASAACARLAEIGGRIGDHAELRDILTRALVESPPIASGEGGIVRDGFDGALDDLRRGHREGKEWIAGLEPRERARTGIASLKVGFNRVFGYYLEATRAHAKLIPAEYERKQTLVNAERYTTAELKEWESKVLGAEERAVAREREIFGMLRDRVASEAAPLLCTAAALAELDFLRALAVAAAHGAFVRPDVDDTVEIDIEEGRHPVVERALGPGSFVPNDTRLGFPGRRIAVVTGPNMAGKSTYLRQVGLIALMAQVGSFVSASKARIGIVDRIFTRVGAADDIARGRSTFLVEMNEASNILRNATSRSLVLLDEIGRGTSTYDGLSIAWAMAEYLHDTPRLRPRTLFATHYHELTELANRHEDVHNLNVLVREWNDELVFMRRVVDGSADRSYGIQVARLAGLPAAVLQRARQILDELESGKFVEREARPREEAQLGLFEPAGERLLSELANLDPDRLTPLEALAALHDLKRRFRAE